MDKLTCLFPHLQKGKKHFFNYKGTGLSFFVVSKLCVISFPIKQFDKKNNLEEINHMGTFKNPHIKPNF